MPVYNSEKNLKYTLESIIGQTFKDFELIAIDDGSTDNSLKILKEYQMMDKRIVVVQQKNSGVSKARNVGIELSRGEYIGFIDSDDLLEKDFFNTLYKLAKKNNADISMTGYSTFYENTNLKLKKYTEDKVEFKNKYNIFENMLDCGLGVNIWTKLYKKSLIDQYNIKFIEEMSYDEDMFFSWKCALVSTKVCFDNNCRYFYRLSPVGATMKYHDNMYDKYCYAFNDIRLFSKENNLYTDELEKYICINFARKINVMLTMIVRSKLPFNQKQINISKILEDKIIKRGIYELDNIYKLKGKKYFLLKDLKNKYILSLIIKTYLIDIKIKLARKIKKYLYK